MTPPLLKWLLSLLSLISWFGLMCLMETWRRETSFERLFSTISQLKLPIYAQAEGVQPRLRLLFIIPFVGWLIGLQIICIHVVATAAALGSRRRDYWVQVEDGIKKKKRFTEKNNLLITPKIVGNYKDAFQAFRWGVICVITGDAKWNWKPSANTTPPSPPPILQPLADSGGIFNFGLLALYNVLCH